MPVAENVKLPKPKVAKKKDIVTTKKATASEQPVSAKKPKTTAKTDLVKTKASTKVKKVSTKLGLSKSFDPIIIEKLKAIISPYTEHPELLKKIEKETNVNFVEKLNIDSVDVVEIVVDVEQEFNITIEDKEIETFKTFEDMYNLIDTKIKEAEKNK